ncbi:hypothetical protein [Desulfonema magnum]|uniref:hypothetical protein n=1 Tax=Desulfonema magnum TaxID=45655 RepID=UPI001A9A7BBD|nr:hypothetical protein [Desulfonema magnum]
MADIFLQKTASLYFCTPENIFLQKTASLCFCTPENIFWRIFFCKKPLRSIFELRKIFFGGYFFAKNRFALFLHSGKYFLHSGKYFLHSGKYFPYADIIKI